MKTIAPKPRTKIVAAAVALTATGAVTAGVFLPAATATAATGQGTVWTRAGVPLSVNDAPRLKSNRKGWVRSGERIKISCQVQGDAVRGPWGTLSLWNYIEGRGYVSDAWINTGSNGRLAGVPDCNTRRPAPKPAPTRPTTRPTTPPNNPGHQYPYSGQFQLPFKRGTGYRVTQTPFGTFTHGANHELGRWNKHAIDFGTPTGTPLYAPGPGKVVFAGWDTTGYGNKILIDHGNNRCSIMAHLQSINVRKGQRIAMGNFVGASGGTGFSNGPHLHFGLVKCSNGDSLEIITTREAGTSYRLNSRPVSTNPTR